MQNPRFSVATLDETVTGAVPVFEAARHTLNEAIETAKKLISSLDPKFTRFHVYTKHSTTHESLKLATVYWDDENADIGIVTFPLAIDKLDKDT